MSAAPLYLVSFPDYDGDLSGLPSTLVDVSWRQDLCPRFLDEAAGLSLWCDYADLSGCEDLWVRPSHRFTLHWTTEGGLPDEFAAEADTLDDILVAYRRLRAEALSREERS